MNLPNRRSLRGWKRLESDCSEFLFPPETDTLAGNLTRRSWFGGNALFAVSTKRLDLSAFGNCSRKLAEALLSLESHFIPRLGWFVTLAAQVGVHEEAVTLRWRGLRLLSAGCGLLVGLASRFSAIVAWFFHLCAAKSGGFVSYGMDNFMTIGLFYLMLSPLPDRYSLDWRFRKLQPKDPQLLRILAARPSAPLVHRLFFQRPNEMLWAPAGGMAPVCGALSSARLSTSSIPRYS